MARCSVKAVQPCSPNHCASQTIAPRAQTACPGMVAVSGQSSTTLLAIRGHIPAAGAQWGG
eukprot:9491029-Alexandrium_andersonii.AAC.1